MMFDNTYFARNQLLKELGYETYHAYLASDLWKSIRERVFANCGNKCRLCPKEARVIHHKGYGRKVLLGIELSPLVPLCHSCHTKIEFWSDGRKKTIVEAHSSLIRFLKPIKLAEKKLTDRRGIPGYCRECSKKAKKGANYCRVCQKARRV